MLDAIDRGDHDDLRGEIGDLIFEGVFLAQIAADDGHFTVADSLARDREKLIRRHPHVFGETAGVETPGQVLEQWEQIKAREQQDGRPHAGRCWRGLPKALPALLRAYEIGTRVAAVGFDWAHATDVDGQDRGGGRRAAPGAVQDEGPRPRRRGDGRPAVLDRQPGAQAGHRAGVGAAQGQQEVHARFTALEAGFRTDAPSTRPRSRRWRPTGSGSRPPSEGPPGGPGDAVTAVTGWRL